MLDIGWSELMVIGVLALLVVGPKELPGLFRTVGQYVGKARSVAREFQRSMEDAARDVDGGALNQIRDAKREFDKMSRVDFSEQAKRAQDSLMSGGKSSGDKSSEDTSSGDKSSGDGTEASAAKASAAPTDPAPAQPKAQAEPKPEPAQAATAAPDPVEPAQAVQTAQDKA
ncbi:MAG: Sec-independent protein translocase protein TatB [Pseudomonadota bacterium]